MAESDKNPNGGDAPKLPRGNPRMIPGAPSLNPKGRPKGSMTYLLDGPERKKFRDALAKLLLAPQSKLSRVMGTDPTGADLVALAWVQGSIAGNPKLLVPLSERILGKVPQQLDHVDAGTLRDLLINEEGVPE